MSRPKRRRKHGANGLNKIQLRWIGPPKDRPWVRIFIDTMDGESWRSLSVNARRVLDAIIAHHFRYWQQSNGELQISYSGFERAGVTRRLIGPAIRELQAAGLIETKAGSPTNETLRPPTLYALPTYRETKDRRFVWVPLEVMESRAWCGLSINARRILDRLLIENARHKAERNGRLQVSYGQFVGHGIGRRLIKSALNKLAEAGLLATAQGKAHGSSEPPNLYRLTFLGTTEGPATWKKPAEPDVIPLPRKPRRQSRKEVLATEYKKHFPPPEGKPAPPSLRAPAKAIYGPKASQ